MKVAVGESEVEVTDINCGLRRHEAATPLPGSWSAIADTLRNRLWARSVAVVIVVFVAAGPLPWPSLCHLSHMGTRKFSCIDRLLQQMFTNASSSNPKACNTHPLLHLHIKCSWTHQVTKTQLLQILQCSWIHCSFKTLMSAKLSVATLAQQMFTNASSFKP